MIAVVSHPGWNSHHSYTDDKYLRLRRQLEDRELPDNDGVLRSRILSVHNTAIPRAHFLVRQRFLEEQLFGYLAFHNIPTIVTVPVIPYNKCSEPAIKKRIDRMVRDSTDFSKIMSFILSQERFRLSRVLSEDFPDYLRDIRSGRENFYLIPTDSRKDDEDKGKAHGTLLGDYEYSGLEQEVVTRFLEAVDGKRVLFAGNDMPGCVDSTLGYFRFVDSNVLVLLNYCGVSNGINLDGDFDEHRLNGQGLFEFVRTHPQERLVIEKVFELFGETLVDIEERTSRNTFYKPSQRCRISAYTGYVTDLDEEW